MWKEERIILRIDILLSIKPQARATDVWTANGVLTWPTVKFILPPSFFVEFKNTFFIFFKRSKLAMFHKSGYLVKIIHYPNGERGEFMRFNGANLENIIFPCLAIPNWKVLLKTIKQISLKCILLWRDLFYKMGLYLQKLIFKDYNSWVIFLIYS